MATAITAPVPVTHSGEVDAAQYPQSAVGNVLADIVGTCTTSGGSVTVRYQSDEANVDVTFTLTATTTNYTTAGKVAYTPLAPGMYKITVTDVSAAQVVTTQVQVFQSEG